MKLPVFSLLCTLILPAVSHAADRGLYIGGGFGYANVDGTADTSTGVVIGTPVGSMFPAILLAGLNGVPFDDSDYARGVFAGYRFDSKWSIQLGVSDIGNYQAAAMPTAAPLQSASLGIDEYSLVAKVKFPIANRFSANGRFGVSYNKFDAGGLAARVVSIPGALITISAPFSDPKSETGYLWGVGAGWEMTSKIGLDLNFVRHETQVISVDTLNLGLIYSF